MKTKLKSPFKEMYENYLLSKESDFLKKYVEYLDYYANNNKVNQLVRKYMDFFISSDPKVFGKDFQKEFNINDFYNNIEDIKRKMTQKNHCFGNYYLSNKLLSLKSISGMPIVVDSVKFCNQTIVVNKNIHS